MMKATRSMMKDPRKGHNGLVSVIGFYYPNRKSAVDRTYEAGFLGNFFPCVFDFSPPGKHSKTFKSSESAYQSTKFDWSFSDQFSKLNGQESYTFKNQLSKSIGYDEKFNGFFSSWNAMSAVLKSKFEKDPMKSALLRTGDAFLVEHNDVVGRDLTWSNNGDGTGKNWLGMLLMLTRDKLRGIDPIKSPHSWSHYISNHIDTYRGTPKSDSWSNAVKAATVVVLSTISNTKTVQADDDDDDDDDNLLRIQDFKGHACGLAYLRRKKLGKDVRIGVGIAGNTGRLYGACLHYSNGRYSIGSVRPNHRTQEESVISNAFSAGTKLLHADGNLPVPWGLLDPSGTDVRTYQKVDYTRHGKLGPNPSKYRHAVSIAHGKGYYQERGKSWDTSRYYDNAVYVVTAGPNVADCSRKGRTSSMRRTCDPDALVRRYFVDAIVFALVAMLDEMIACDVRVAIVPGLSTGLYSGPHREYINSPGVFIRLIDMALKHGGVDRRKKFDEVWYAHY